MATGYGHIRSRAMVDEHQNRDEHWQTWKYQTPRDATLANVSLEKGDNLPEDSNFQIMESDRNVDKRAGCAWVTVKAVKFFAYA